jgi:protein ImuB
MSFAKGARAPQRILSLWFPHLPADRLLRQRMGKGWRAGGLEPARPLVFSRRESNTQRVAALDAGARRLKLKHGMGVAEARALYPSLEIVELDPGADRRLLESLADWCDRYTPLVAVDREDGLFLDITGCAHLFGGERALLDDLLARFFHQGFDVRAGLASTPGAAWAAARYGHSDHVAAGAEEDLLAPLPLAALRIDAEIRMGLESVGLRTAGSILAAPRAPLVRRFGRMVTLRIDQALGRVEEPISPRLPVPPLMVERRLAEPIDSMDDIEAIVLLLARQLRIDLERRCEGVERLELKLFRVDGDVGRIEVRTSRPLREPGPIRKLFHERLTAHQGQIDVGCGFDLVRLCALDTAPLDAVQVGLDDAGRDAEGDVTLFVDRVSARLGSGAIRQARPAESHVPERAVVLEAFDEWPEPRSSSGRAHVSQLPTKERPSRLLDLPECVEVTFAEVPEGPPLHFRWRRAAYRVVRAEGPERIAPEWWREPEAADPRDYYRVEDEEGRRYWLYRQGLYGATAPRWYLQGVFA